MANYLLFWFCDGATFVTCGGFAAVTAAVVGAPISVVLIVFELTQSYEFAVAAMLAAVIATFLTSLVFGHSFFDEQSGAELIYLEAVVLSFKLSQLLRSSIKILLPLILRHQ